MVSEITSLTELALSKGAKLSTLLVKIENSILDEYKNKFPSAPINASVSLDVKSGKVRIYNNDKDITPEEFIADAERIARATIIEELKTAEKETKEYPTVENESKESDAVITKLQNINKGATFDVLGKIIFWLYNGIYMLVILANLISIASYFFNHGIFQSLNELGAYRSFLLIILSALPFVTVYLAYKVIDNKVTNKLAKIFFLFEIPILTLTLFAFNSSTTLIPVVIFFHLILLLIPIMFVFQLSKINFSEPWKVAGILGVQQLIFSTSSYIVLLFSFFFPLFIIHILKDVIGGSISRLFSYGAGSMLFTPSIEDIFGSIILLFIGLLFLMFIIFLLLLPYLVTFYFYRLVTKSRIKLLSVIEETQVNGYQIALGIVFVAFLVIVSIQSNVSVLVDRLDQFGKATTYEEKERLAKEIIPQKDLIKQAIQDSYNFRQRYLFAKDDTTLSREYEYTLGLDKTISSAIQNTFLTVAYPFVYQGSTNTSGNNYSLNYESLFDEYYYGSTYKPTEFNYVKLVKRDIKATTDYQGVLATITIEDEFQNTGYRSEEVIYEFSLPEDAVITDLKLGPNLEYPGTVAPKGAAAKTYQTEVNKSRDPALLEQVGPRQYRLRVFPIPSLSDSFTLKGLNQKVQFSYVVGVSAAGYQLPVYTKQQNLKTENILTNVVLNGKSYKFDKGQNVTAIDINNFNEMLQIMPEICKTGTQSIKKEMGTSKASIVPLWSIPSIKDNYTCTIKDFADLSNLFKNYKIAVYLDTSLKNKDNKSGELLRNYLRNKSQLLESNNFTLYLYNTSISNPIKLNKDNLNIFDNLTYFGKTDFNNTISKLDDSYDLVIMIPNSSEYTTGPNINIDKSIPVYVLYDDVNIPSFNNYLTSFLIQHQGSVVNNPYEAINNFVLSKELTKDKSGYIKLNSLFAIQTDSKSINTQPVSTLTLDEFTKTNSTDPLGYLVAKSYFNRKLSLLNTDILNQLSLMDNANNFAKTAHIVTPFSSLISLVNTTQQQNLDYNSQSYDRYEERAPSPSQGMNIMPTQPSGISFNKGFGISSMVGVDVSNSTLPTLDSGGSSSGISAPSAFSSSSVFSFGDMSFLLLINFFVVGVGVFVFVVIKLRKKILKK